ncbi:hypothetical protein MKX01_037926, partial [Papaver californicum]
SSRWRRPYMFVPQKLQYISWKRFYAIKSLGIQSLEVKSDVRLFVKWSLGPLPAMVRMDCTNKHGNQ